jgi:predicted acyl esterase
MQQAGARTRARTTILCVAVLALAAFAPAASAAPPPDGSKWTEHFIDEADGTQLHADVLRPANLPDNARTPVILSIGPYFNHSGQTGVLGPVEETPYDPLTGQGPSDRFYDFINGTKLLEKGYTWVQVDLRGFGGSSGCLDWGGPGEQADVKAAVEWAAAQDWSTGKVGMYGKSYDGVTGLVGIAQQPKGLEAVIAQEPVYDLYRYLYMNRVRFSNSLATPALYDAIAGSPGSASDTVAYNSNSVNDTPRPGCPLQNYADQQDPNHDSAYWKARDLITASKGKKTPLFLTQGFLENNTKPDGAYDFYNGLAGPKRAWLGMWDHVRGNDRDNEGRLLMGREGWFQESMNFYDQYLKGAPKSNDPPNAVQTSDGNWRSEKNWPPKDSIVRTSTLNGGSYSDDGTNNGTGDAGPPNGQGGWTFSPPFASDAHFAGVPRVTADLDFPVSNANFVADVYDLDPAGNATLVSRGAYLAPSSGKVSFDLYGNDWKFPAGHRLGILVTGANAEWWVHTPTGQSVEVNNASISLPFLGCRRTEKIQGNTSVKLEDYLESVPFSVDADTIDEATRADFNLPPDQGTCTKREIENGGPSRGCVDRRKFRFRLRHGRHQRVTRVRVFVNKRLVIKKRGRNLRYVTLRKLPLGRFKVKIVKWTNDNHKTTTIRYYKGCRKTRPTGHHTPAHHRR